MHDPFWTATARHADIVLPVTMTIKRYDYGSGQNDRMFFPTAMDWLRHLYDE